MTRLLDGRAIARAIEAELLPESDALARSGVRPGLAILQFGVDDASRVYTRSIEKTCARLGVTCLTIDLPRATSASDAHERLDALNADPSIHGILIKRPLPPHLDADRFVQSIAVAKDVDGATHVQIGRTATAHPLALSPCTPLAVIAVLARSGIGIAGKHVAIVGRSDTVGRPLALLLSHKGDRGDATVTLCHSATRDLAAHTRRADIVVAAIGRARAIGRDHVAEHATVIDVGINVLHGPDGSETIVGDVDAEALLGRCAALTPVPGGVGPVTVSMLLRNVLAAAKAAGSRAVS